MTRCLKKETQMGKKCRLLFKNRLRAPGQVRKEQECKTSAVETSKIMAPKIQLYRKYKYLNTEVTQVYTPQKPLIYLNKKKTTHIVLQNLNSLIQLDGSVLNTFDSSYVETEWRVLNSKNIKCSCVKNQCQKLYCVCYQRNVPCHMLCSCCNCANFTSGKQKQLTFGCKCIKSKCLSNYCPCHIKGINCGQSCQCCECSN